MVFYVSLYSSIYIDQNTRKWYVFGHCLVDKQWEIVHYLYTEWLGWRGCWDLGLLFWGARILTGAPPSWSPPVPLVFTRDLPLYLYFWFCPLPSFYSSMLVSVPSASWWLAYWRLSTKSYCDSVSKCCWYVFIQGPTLFEGESGVTVKLC